MWYHKLEAENKDMRLTIVTTITNVFWDMTLWNYDHTQTVSQIPWNGNSRFPKNFGSELHGIPSKKRVILQVWRDHKTINFANSILLEVILTMWQRDLKVQYCQYQSPTLDIIISQLHSPPVPAIHPSKSFWLLSIVPKTKCFYQSFFKKLHTKTLHVHVFMD